MCFEVISSGRGTPFCSAEWRSLAHTRSCDLSKLLFEQVKIIFTFGYSSAEDTSVSQSLLSLLTSNKQVSRMCDI